LIAVAASGVAATMTYLWIEKPIRRAKAVKPSAVYLAVGMALCGLAGTAIYLMGGLDFRLPQQFTHFTHLPPGEDTHTDCFLEDKSDFLPNCTEVLRRPALFVWGDSHADRLYWGLKSMQEKGQIGLLQVTGASCPPILGFKSYRNNKCEDVNAYALQAFGALGPTSSSYTPVGYSIASTFQSLLPLFSRSGTRVSERSFCSGQFRYGAAAPYFALCFAVGDR